MKHQAGFTLVELMIASLIGLFLMGSLMNLFITTNRSVTLSDALAQNQETGRFAMDYMTRFIRKAGSTENFTIFVPPLILKNDPTDCVNNPNDPECASGEEKTITCFASPEKEACSSNNPVDPNYALGDILSVSYLATPGERTCTGTVMAAETQVSNVFWVSAEADTEFELRCRTYNFNTKTWMDNPVSIVNNIESFEFQVGVASSEKDKNANRYVNIETINNNPDITMNHFRSIRIAILTTSQNELDENKLTTNIQERKYTLLDGPLITKNDGNLRHIFSNTIELPNMIEGTVFN